MVISDASQPCMGTIPTTLLGGHTGPECARVMAIKPVGGGGRDRPGLLGAALAASVDGCSSLDVEGPPLGGTPHAAVTASVGAGVAGEIGASRAVPAARGGSAVGEPPTPVGGGGRDRPGLLGAALAASVDGRSSLDVEGPPLGGTPHAAVTASVGAGVAGEIGASCAAPVARGGSVGEPPTPVGGGGRDQPGLLGAALAASVDGRSSLDVEGPPLGGTPHAAVSHGVGRRWRCRRDRRVTCGSGCARWFGRRAANAGRRPAAATDPVCSARRSRRPSTVVRHSASRDHHSAARFTRPSRRRSALALPARSARHVRLRFRAVVRSASRQPRGHPLRPRSMLTARPLGLDTQCKCKS